MAANPKPAPHYLVGHGGVRSPARVAHPVAIFALADQQKDERHQCDARKADEDDTRDRPRYAMCGHQQRDTAEQREEREPEDDRVGPAVALARSHALGPRASSSSCSTIAR